MSSQIIDMGKSVVMCTRPHNTNIICIELDGGLVFVDSGRQDDVAIEFRQQMEKRFNKKATHLLLTHYHHDHISGMSAFKDVEIIGSKTGHKKYLEDLEGPLSKEGRKTSVEQWKKMAVEQNWDPSDSRTLLWKYYPKVDIFPPTKATDEFEIGSGKQKVIFKRVGGHTECSAYIYLPHEDMVLLGDNFVGNLSSVGGCFFGGLRENIIPIYDEIINLKPKMIVPGHGPEADLAYLVKARDYYKGLFKALGEIFDKGIKESELLAYEGFPEFFDEKPEYWDSRVLPRLYKEIGAEKTIAEIDKKLDKLNQASLENNLDKLLKFFTEDLIVTVRDGFYVQGQDDYRNRFRATNNIEITSERKDHYYIGDKFVERVITTSKSQNNGKTTTTESDAVHIWVKEKGQWKINMEIRIGEKEI
ncbi:MAG: MBL fold metallo-hydrolase [Candidatus Heimdallarchaeota archaeon]